MSKNNMIKPGDIIVSSPYADTGIVFSKSVIYIMSHDETGTTGVIINKLLKNLDNLTISKALNNNLDFSERMQNILPIYFGGPIEQEKGIILHSSDYNKTSFSNFSNNISISVDSQVVTDIMMGTGPRHKMLVLGYTAWSSNQLLAEIKRNDWLMPIKPIDQKTIYDLIFVEDYYSRWNSALKLSGVNLGNYSNIVGNA